MAAGDALPGLAERLRTTRQDRSLTRDELATIVGCSYTAVAGVENEHSLPSLVLAVRLAEALETTVDYLATGRQP